MSAEPITARSPRVLIVDDDITLRILVRGTLEAEGFHVTEAEDGSELVEAYRNHDPDLILLDVLMPLRDGYSACQELTQLLQERTPPILMMTGLEDLESINRAYESGATDFITKPINPKILSHRLRYMLRSSVTLRELRRSQTGLAAAQRIAQLGSWELEVASGKVHISSEAYRILGLIPGETEPNWADLLSLIDPADRGPLEAALERARESDHSINLDVTIVTPSGTPRVLHIQAQPAVEGTGARTIVGTLQDITERRNAERQIHHLAYYDSLTGLPNRVLFKERLTEALLSARVYQKMVAVFFLDLDRFKRINDTLGHNVGDALLQEVSNRLRQALRTSDYAGRLTPLEQSTAIARLGGDEFTVVLPNLTYVQDAAKIAGRVIETLSQPFSLAEQEFFVTTSIGIALYPFNGDSVDVLLKNADTAMYSAKDQGRNNYQFYSQSMNASAFERLSLESSLRRALEREEFVLHYQPQWSLKTRRLVGLEALVRWNHPDLGLVLPSSFIHVAEEAGLLKQIDAEVLKLACVQSRLWRDKGLPRMRVAVNISNQQFQDKDFSRSIRELLQLTGMRPAELELELTENIMLQNAETAVETVRGLKEIGVELSIDDFGTGYSSMTHLKRLRVDRLKIDRSFIQDLTLDPDDVAIVKAILALAQNMGIQAIAEGVETPEQAQLLSSFGCDEIQGNLISRPLPAERVAELIRDGLPSSPNTIDLLRVEDTPLPSR